MSEPEKRDTWQELCDLIEEAGLRVVFWTCPKGCNGMVKWHHEGGRGPDAKPGGKSTPTCQTCGETGAPR